MRLTFDNMCFLPKKLFFMFVLCSNCVFQWSFGQNLFNWTVLWYHSLVWFGAAEICLQAIIVNKDKDMFSELLPNWACMSRNSWAKPWLVIGLLDYNPLYFQTLSRAFVFVCIPFVSLLVSSRVWDYHLISSAGASQQCMAFISTWQTIRRLKYKGLVR